MGTGTSNDRPEGETSIFPRARRRESFGIDQRVALSRKRLWAVEVRLTVIHPALLASNPLVA